MQLFAAVRELKFLFNIGSKIGLILLYMKLKAKCIHFMKIGSLYENSLDRVKYQSCKNV
jgi:hypothetical protein